jgi:hypothetical protein
MIFGVKCRSSKPDHPTLLNTEVEEGVEINLHLPVYLEVVLN